VEAIVRLDHQLLAVESEHEVNVMLELAAPAAEAAAKRPPLNLALVLDRSGSMAGEKLWYAKRAVSWLLTRLEPTDRVAIVAFDDDALLAAPLAPAELGLATDAVGEIGPGNMTNLSGGWLKGIEELRRAPEDEPRKLIVLSDGMANVGITKPGALVSLAGSVANEGIGTTTIGYGADFDEDLLTALADAGGGNAHYAKTAESAPAIFAQEFDGLTRLVAQNVSVEILPAAEVEVLTVLNDYPQLPVPGGVQIALGDAYAGETRRVVLSLHIPELAELGVAKVADLVVRYVSVGDGVNEHVLTVPVAVNLVSSDEAAASAPDLAVTEQVHLLRAARARDEAVRLADAGDFEGAQTVAMQADAELRGAGLNPEADAFDAKRLLPPNYGPRARKQLRYESQLRRRRRDSR
jgi:Ca-activated chloride channel family protein